MLFEECLEILQSKRYKAISKSIQEYGKSLSNFIFDLSNRQSYHDNLSKIKNSFQGIQMDLQDLNTDLDSLNLFSVKEVVSSLKTMIEEMQVHIISNCQKSRTNMSNVEETGGSLMTQHHSGGFCLECREIIQKKQIQKMRKEIIVTDLEVDDLKFMSSTLSQDKILLQDSFSLDDKIHLDTLQKTLNEQKSFLLNDSNKLCMTYDYLLKVSAETDKDIVDLTQEMLQTRQNTKQVNQLSKMTSEKFKQTIERSLKSTIWEIICNVLKKRELKEKIKREGHFKEREVQTIPINQKNKTDQFKKDIELLKKENDLLRRQKMQIDQITFKNLEIERDQKQNILDLHDQIAHWKIKYQFAQQRSKIANEKLETINSKQNDEIKRNLIQRKEEEQKIRVKERQLKKKMSEIQKDNMKKSKKSVISRVSIFSRKDKENNHNNFYHHDDDFIDQSSIEAEHSEKINQSKKVAFIFEEKMSRDESSSQKSQTLSNEKKKIIAIKRSKTLCIAPQIFQLQIKSVSPIFLPAADEKANKDKKNHDCDYSHDHSHRKTQNSRFSVTGMKNIKIKTFRTKIKQKFYEQSLTTNHYESSNCMEKINSNLTERSTPSLKAIRREKTEANTNANMNANNHTFEDNNILASKSIDKINKNRVLVKDLKKARNYFKQCQEGKASKLAFITLNHLYLFGGEKCAMDYEKNQGIWPNLEVKTKLILDFQNATLGNNIQRYFKFLETSNNDKYQEYLLFLNEPYSFLFDIDHNSSKSTKKILLLQKDNKNFIKSLFCKLIRFHRICHQNCTHVSEFLEEIGFHEL